MKIRFFAMSIIFYIIIFFSNISEAIYICTPEEQNDFDALVTDINVKIFHMCNKQTYFTHSRKTFFLEYFKRHCYNTKTIKKACFKLYKNELQELLKAQSEENTDIYSPEFNIQLQMLSTFHAKAQSTIAKKLKNDFKNQGFNVGDPRPYRKKHYRICIGQCLIAAFLSDCYVSD